jgi:hypothetical protein
MSNLKAMKLILFFLLSVLTFISTNGQTIFVIKKNDYLKLLKKGSLTFKNPKDSIILSELFTLKSQKAKMLYKTDKGKVYQLLLDNMRCLVPEFKSNMPVYKGVPNHILPNTQQKIVPVPIPNPFNNQNSIPTPEVKKVPLPELRGNIEGVQIR